MRPADDETVDVEYCASAVNSTPYNQLRHLAKLSSPATIAPSGQVSKCEHAVSIL